MTRKYGQTIYFPRVLFDDVSKRKEPRKSGIYFLFGIDESDGAPICYIGQGIDCLKRIQTHDQEKDFWQEAVIFVSKINAFTHTDIKFLEAHCIEKASEAKRYKLKNANKPIKATVTEAMEADLFDDFECLVTLLSTLGYRLFETLDRHQGEDIFFCKGPEAYATGIYNEEGFIVFKGSTARIQETSSISQWVKKIRQELISQGILSKAHKGKCYEFIQDYSFPSPSSASSVILARSSNGWKDWKLKSEENYPKEIGMQPSTLDDAKRPKTWVLRVKSEDNTDINASTEEQA